MDKLNLHWTSKSISAFVHRLSFDFITQIQQRLQNAHVTRKEFATRLKVTPGRVSQVFNDPGNITVERAVEYAQGAGMKVSLVAYDDSDPQNEKGPINSEVFRRCWQLHGCPHDLLDMGSATGRYLVLRHAEALVVFRVARRRPQAHAVARLYRQHRFQRAVEKTAMHRGRRSHLMRCAMTRCASGCCPQCTNVFGAVWVIF